MALWLFLACISIHSPRAGRDPFREALRGLFQLFQSTRPVRGETEVPAAAVKIIQISIHSPRAGRDGWRGAISRRSLISIHSPRAGRDRIPVVLAIVMAISIHSPRAGRDRIYRHAPRIHINFNPLAPCGARPSRLTNRSRRYHFNPLAPCGARRRVHDRGEQIRPISIHSPRAGRDEMIRFPSSTRAISIHSPRAGRDHRDRRIRPDNLTFQSTRPVRGETLKLSATLEIFSHFNPLAPCGARPRKAQHGIPQFVISIHSPRAGRDGNASRLVTPRDISIHSPRAGRDRRSGGKRRRDPHFNPLAPCGARQPS